MSTAPDRITRVRFAGLRTAASVELDLEGLTVLIGPNGVGKSSLVEGFELLRRVMVSEDFIGTLHDDHGGPIALVTHGARELKLGVDVTTKTGSFSYEIALGDIEGEFGIACESLHERRARRGRVRRAARSEDGPRGSRSPTRGAAAAAARHPIRRGSVPPPAVRHRRLRR